MASIFEMMAMEEAEEYSFGYVVYKERWTSEGGVSISRSELEKSVKDPKLLDQMSTVLIGNRRFEKGLKEMVVEASSGYQWWLPPGSQDPPPIITVPSTRAGTTTLGEKDLPSHHHNRPLTIKRSYSTNTTNYPSHITAPPPSAAPPPSTFQRTSVELCKTRILKIVDEGAELTPLQMLKRLKEKEGYSADTALQALEEMGLGDD